MFIKTKHKKQNNLLFLNNNRIISLRKHAHAIYRKFFGCENENFHWKIFEFFVIFAQNINCVYTFEPHRRGGSNEYPQSMFWSKNNEKYVYTCKPHFYNIKWGMMGYTLYGHVFLMSSNVRSRRFHLQLCG